MEDAAIKRYAAVAGLASDLVHTLHDEMLKLGFTEEQVVLQSADDAIYRLEKDTFNGEHSLIGEWRNEQGIKEGQLLFHSDGSYMAEFDVVAAHPSRKQFFVESVLAWGKDSNIKSEAKLLPMP